MTAFSAGKSDDIEGIDAASGLEGGRHCQADDIWVARWLSETRCGPQRQALDGLSGLLMVSGEREIKRDAKRCQGSRRSSRLLPLRRRSTSGMRDVTVLMNVLRTSVPTNTIAALPTADNATSSSKYCNQITNR